MKNKYTSGLTILELLISIGLASILLLALGAFFSQNSQAALQLNTRSDMQQETIIAQQLITGRLREAVYVMPAGQTLVLSSSAASAPTYTNPVGARRGSPTWITGSDPILAMVLPPKDGSAGENCLLTTTTTTPTGNDACYRFYAYYPVNRKTWTDGTSGSNDPGVDATNENTWVLVQYMSYLSGDFYDAEVTNMTSATPVTIPRVIDYVNFKISNAQILADYIEPTVNDTTTAGVTNANTTYTMFTYANSTTPGIAPTAAKPVDTVTVNLASARLLGGKLMHIPGPTYTSTGTLVDAYPEYSITVNLSNQGKVAAKSDDE